MLDSVQKMCCDNVIVDRFRLVSEISSGRGDYRRNHSRELKFMTV